MNKKSDIEVPDNIKVFLTTTKYMIPSKNDTTMSRNLKYRDIPYCSGLTFIPLFDASEKELSNISVFLIDGMKKVFVYPEEKRIFIGKDPDDMYTCALDYISKKNDHYADSFFKRWNEIKATIVDISIISCPPEKIKMVEKYRTFINVNGVWEQNKWRWLKRIKMPMFLTKM